MKMTLAFTLFVMVVNGHVLGGNAWALPSNVGSTANTTSNNEVKGMIEMTHLEKLYAALKIVGTAKETESEFKKSMEYLCLAVRSVYRFAEMHNASVYNGTDDEMKQARPKVESMTAEDKLKFMVNLLTTNMPKFNQAFLFLADWSCQAGYEYEQAVEAVKKMAEAAKGNNQSGKM